MTSSCAPFKALAWDQCKVSLCVDLTALIATTTIRVQTVVLPVADEDPIEDVTAWGQVPGILATLTDVETIEVLVTNRRRNFIAAVVTVTATTSFQADAARIALQEVITHN